MFPRQCDKKFTLFGWSTVTGSADSPIIDSDDCSMSSSPVKTVPGQRV